MAGEARGMWLRVLAAVAVLGIGVSALGSLLGVAGVVGDAAVAITLAIAVVTVLVVVATGRRGAGGRTPYW